MSNTFGNLFRITTFGESHGEYIGVVLDGCPTNIHITELMIDNALITRHPSNLFPDNKVYTKRVEKDKCKIISGVFNSYTTGAPITILIKNTSVISKDYDEVQKKYRPGHADYTYHKKYTNNDYRGGGRASGRETAVRVAAGAIAKEVVKCLGYNISVHAYVSSIGNINTDIKNAEDELQIISKTIRNNKYYVANTNTIGDIDELIEKLEADNNSIGGAVKSIVSGVPTGLGEPIFNKLDAQLAFAMLSIPAIKGIEFGNGFESTKITGSENNDEITTDGFLSNNSGGVLGGITTGQNLIFRTAIKPVPSIARAQKTIIRESSNNSNNKDTDITVVGRHDICIAPRIAVVIEYMTWLVLADFVLMSQIGTRSK